MLQKEIEIEYDDGTKKKVTLQRLTEREFRPIETLLMPPKVKMGQPVNEYEIEAPKLRKYQDELIKASIFSPKEVIKDIDNLIAAEVVGVKILTRESYRTLMDAANELNSMSEDTAKKS